MNSFKLMLVKIYSFKFFDDFILIYPLYAVMFSDNGLSTLKISVLLFVWSFTAFVLEIPSGVWADRYSRKNILIIGQLLRAIGYGLWLLYPGFVGFMIGFIFWGVKSALTSGTFEALVYDELKQTSQELTYAKVIGRAESLSLAGVILAGFCASIFSQSGYQLLLFPSIGAVIISGLSIALLPKSKIIKSTLEVRYLAHLKEGLRLVKNNTQVLKILLFASFGLAVGGVDEFFGLFFKDLGLSNSEISLWAAVGSVVGIVGSLAAYRLEKVSNTKFAGMLALLGCLLTIGGLTKSPVALIAITGFVMLLQLLKVIFDARLQHVIEDKTRATVSSVQGFMSEVGTLSVFLLFGFIAKSSSNAVPLIVFGILIVLVSLLYQSVIRKWFN